MSNNESSYSAINNFKSQFCLNDGNMFLASIDVEELNGNFIWADTCNCLFTYNVPFMQSELTILWTYSDEQVANKKLRKSYNTTHHSFSFENDELIVKDSDKLILVKFFKRG